MTRKTRIIFAVIAGSVFCMHLSNIWRLETNPFTDLPNHLSEAYLFKALADPNNPLQSYYKNEITVVTPGTLHTIFCALFPDVETGNRVFYSLYMAVLLLGMVIVVHAAKGDVWIALLSMVFFYNFSTLWGFAGYTMGLALLLVAVAVLLKFNDQPTLFRAGTVCILMLLLYYCHILVFFFAVVAFAVIILRQKDFVSHHLLGLVALTPGVILSLLWISRSPSLYSSTHAFLLNYYQHEYTGSLIVRLYTILFIDNFLDAGRGWKLFSLAFSAPLLGGLAAGLLLRRGDPPGVHATTKVRRAAQWFLLVGALCFLFAPNRLPGWMYFFERFSVITLLGIIWLLSFVFQQRVLAFVRVCVVLIVVVHAGAWYQYFGQFREAAKPFQTLLYKNPDAAGRSLAAIIADYDFRGHPAFIHYQNYQLIWNGGAVTAKFAEYRFRLFGKRNPDVLPDYYEWVSSDTWAEALVGRYENMDLLLCHGSAAMGDTVERRGYDLLARSDGWMLYRRR